MPINKTHNNSIKELKYEQAYEMLVEIVDRMNDASVPLDELVSLYEKGMALAEHCEALLKSYESRMKMVSKKALAAEIDKLSEDTECADDMEEEND